MKQRPSPKDHEEDQKIINLLKDLGASRVEYPSEFSGARRSSFITQVEQLQTNEEKLSSRALFIKWLKSLVNVRAEQPPELLASRPAEFISQIEKLNAEMVEEEISAKDKEIIKVLANLTFFEANYPPKLLAARRSAFIRHIKWAVAINLLKVLRTSLQNILRYKINIPTRPSLKLLKMSLVVAGLIMVGFIGSQLFGNNEKSLKPSPSQVVAQPALVFPTNTYQAAGVICKQDDHTPPCTQKELDPSQDLAYPGNGLARPAVSKDAMRGRNGVYKAVYVNDGRRGDSWVSDSADSWIKIDLGKATTFNTVSFQKGSVVSLKDSNPGQFVIAVAISDVYADGDSRNDFVEYAQVFNSEKTGFSGALSDAETIRALFSSVKARYVKITFKKANTAIEEVKVFILRPSTLAGHPTRKPKDDEPSIASTPISTNTLVPMASATPIPTDTLQPTETSIPTLTNTPPPTDTPVPLPTNTPPSIDTVTAVPTVLPTGTLDPVVSIRDTPVGLTLP